MHPSMKILCQCMTAGSKGYHLLYWTFFSICQKLQAGQSMSFLLLQASYHAWPATRTGRPCWLPAPI